MRSGPTLPRGPGSMASIATCAWLMKNGCRMLRASIFSSVVWKKMLSLVRMTVPLGMRISEVVRFVKRSSPTALDSSVREPVAGPVILPLIGAVSVCAAMSPPGPARRSNSRGPSGDVAGATTTVAYGATTARRIAPAAKRLNATAKVRRKETRGRAPSDTIVARATRRASVSRSVGSSSRRSSAARPAKAGMCTDAASERAGVGAHDHEPPPAGAPPEDLEEDRVAHERRARRPDEDDVRARVRVVDATGRVEDGRARVEVDHGAAELRRRRHAYAPVPSAAAPTATRSSVPTGTS